VSIFCIESGFRNMIRNVVTVGTSILAINVACTKNRTILTFQCNCHCSVLEVTLAVRSETSSVLAQVLCLEMWPVQRIEQF
jgi:hypothetical protein